MKLYTLDQRRAQAAIARHLAYPPDKGEPWGDFWGDYAATANGLPPAIRENGLILALATEIARAARKLEAGQIAVLADLCVWLGEWANTHRFAPGWLPTASLPWPARPEDEKKAEAALKSWQESVVAAAQAALASIIVAEFGRYRVIGEETLAYLAWLKTLAKARVKDASPADAAGAGKGVA